MEAFQGPRWRDNGSRPPGPVHGFIRRSFPNSLQMRPNCPPFMERNWGRNNDRHELWNGCNDHVNFPMNHPPPTASPQGPGPPPSHGSPSGGMVGGVHQPLPLSPEKNGSPEKQWSGGNMVARGGPPAGPRPPGFHHPHPAAAHHMNRRGRNIKRPLLNGHLVQSPPPHHHHHSPGSHGTGGAGPPPHGLPYPSPMATTQFSNPNTTPVLYHNPHHPHPGREGDPSSSSYHQLPSLSQSPPVAGMGPSLPSPHTPHGHHLQYPAAQHQAHTYSKHSSATLTPSDQTLPLNQDTRSMDSPLSSFASPSSNESENSSPIPRDPRDPRHRSASTNSGGAVTSQLHNCQDRSKISTNEYHHHRRQSFDNHPHTTDHSLSNYHHPPLHGTAGVDPTTPSIGGPDYLSGNRPFHHVGYTDHQYHHHTGTTGGTGSNDPVVSISSLYRRPLSHVADRNNHLPAANGCNMMSRRGKGAITGSQQYSSPGSYGNNSVPSASSRLSNKANSRLPLSVYKDERHSIDHSYTSHEPPKVDINRPPATLQRSYHRTLMPCVSIDIPIPTLDSQLLTCSDDHHDREIDDDNNDNDEDVIITRIKGSEDEHGDGSDGNNLLITDSNSNRAIEYIIIDADESIATVESLNTDTFDHSDNDESDRHPPPPADSGSGMSTIAINNLSSDITDQERTVSVASDSNSDVCFSISPFSIDSFNIDLDTEIESTISPISSNLQSSEDDMFPLPLNISFPLSKVSLPTKVLLKPPIASSPSCPVAPPKSNPSIETHPLVNKIQTRSTLKKQQTDGLQLRNRALPRRNLYLFASRKAPTRTNKDASNNSNSTNVTSKSDEELAMDVDSVAADSDSNTTPQIPANLDNSFIIIDETDDSLDTSSGSLETTVYFKKGSPESEDYTQPTTPIANVDPNESFSPLPHVPTSPLNNKAIETMADKPLPPTEERSKKKPQKFQDFVPIVLKSRSRAETKTIQRRQKMAIEMQRNERESKVAPSHDTQQDSISSHTRRRKRGREKQQSPIGSSQDDVSSIHSEPVSDSTNPSSSIHTDVSSFTPKEFSADVINRTKRIMMNTKNRSGSGDTGLHYICRTGKYDILCYLLANEEKYEVNIQDNAGWTPLHEACSKGHKNIVMLLMEHGANPNLQASDGTRPIHDAIESGHFDIVKYLVDHGADPTVEYSEKTPVELANTSGYPEIAEYLTEIYHKQKLSDIHKSSNPTPNKTIQVRSVKSRVSDDEICLPIEGYQEPLLGPELDRPVFMVSAVIEMSSEPMLPVYNLKVCSGFNPRRHNFHILTDVLEHLNISREDLLSKLSGINSYSVSVNEFITQVRNNQLTKHAKIIDKLKQVDQNSAIELIPLCSGLHELLSIIVENIDD